MPCISKICKSLLVAFVLLIIFIPGIAEASLSWECTHWKGSYMDGYSGYYYTRSSSGTVDSSPTLSTSGTGGTAYCSSATISGSISASISSSDRQDIANRVSNLSIIQGISSNASSAASRASTAISRATQARDYAQQARDAVNNLSIPTVNEIQSGLATGSEVSSSRDTIRQDISEIETKLTSEFENKDSTPPTLEIWWDNNKNSTTNNSEWLNIDAYDKVTTFNNLTFEYRLDGNPYVEVGAASRINIDLAEGHNTIVFRVTDEAGNATTKKTEIWKL